MADLILPRGELKVLQAEDKEYKRGVLMKLLDKGGYKMAYWLNKPDKPYPVEIIVDGKSVAKAGKVVHMKFHPKDYYDKNVEEGWSKKYKKSIDCNNPKGFSQKAHCQGRKKREHMEINELVPNMAVVNPQAYNQLLKKQLTKTKKVGTALKNKKDPLHKRALQLVKRFIKKEMLNPPNYLRNVGNVPQNNPDGEHRFKKGKDQEESVVKTDKVENMIRNLIRTEIKNIRESQMMTEEQFDEKAGKKDACYHKVKARYDVWPSAYASGALVKCRKVGAKNWGNKSKKESVDEVKLNELKMSMEKFTDKLLNALEGDTADLSFGIKHNNKIEKMMSDVMDVDTYYQVKDKKEMIKGLKKVKSNVVKIKSLNKSIFDKVLSDIDTAYKTFETNIQKRIQISESKKEGVKEGFSSDAQRRAAFASGYEEKGKKKKKKEGYPGISVKPLHDDELNESYDLWMEDGSWGYTMTGLVEAEYQGRKVKLGKPMQGDSKKFKVYVKNPKGNVVKVNFGQGGDAKGGTMRIRKSNPKARANFRARHNCDSPGPRHKARYWSCRKW